MELNIFDLLDEHGVTDGPVAFDRNYIAYLVDQVRQRPDFPLTAEETEQELLDALASSNAVGQQLQASIRNEGI